MGNLDSLLYTPQQISVLLEMATATIKRAYRNEVRRIVEEISHEYPNTVTNNIVLKHVLTSEWVGRWGKLIVAYITPSTFYSMPLEIYGKKTLEDIIVEHVVKEVTNELEIMRTNTGEY